MKAKSFIKENVLGAIALATILGFSAFKLTDSVNRVQANNWHEVEENGDLNPSGQITPPGDCPTEGDEYCSLQITLNSGVTQFPETVTEALAMEAANQLTINDRRYKE